MSIISSKTILIGNFDGLHLGHQKLIKFAQNLCKESGTQLTLVTFRPHPRKILSNKGTNLLLPYEEKLNYLKDLGIDLVDEINFNLDISKLSPEHFIEEFLIKRHNPKNIVVGKNFKFGFKASGNVDTLRKFVSPEVEIFPIDIEEISGERISSTIIKDFLSKGDVGKTKDFLGRYYSISGVVVHGEQRGREIGFPTANLNTKFEFLPMNGVYVTYINLGNNKLEGITNIGFRPTFGKKDLLIESHIFDFNQSIYNQEITIEFINRIRSEKKFDSVEKLIENINKDVEHGRRVFKSKND